MNPRTAALATIALLAPLALTAAPASAEDQLKVAIGQINNWENQAPTLGQDAGIFKKHNLVLENVGTQGAGETIHFRQRRSRRRRWRCRRPARVRARRSGAHPAAGLHRDR
jgi:hypothetical protein